MIIYCYWLMPQTTLVFTLSVVHIVTFDKCVNIRYLILQYHPEQFHALNIPCPKYPLLNISPSSLKPWKSLILLQFPKFCLFQNFWNHRVCSLFRYFFLASAFKVPPCFVASWLITFYLWITFHCMNVKHFYPFVFRRTSWGFQALTLLNKPAINNHAQPCMCW